MWMQSPDGKVVKQILGKNLQNGCLAQGWKPCDPPKKRNAKDFYVNETSFNRR